jgi:hypothetical protein
MNRVDRRVPSRLLRPSCVVVLVLACVAPGRPASAGPTVKVADAEYPSAFRARVRKAIEAGVAYLRTKQLVVGARPLPGEDAAGAERRDHVNYEEAAAVTWVLRRVGSRVDDPALATAAATLRARAPRSVEEASLVLLALTAQPLADANPFAFEEPARKGAPPVPVLSKEDRSTVEGVVKYVVGEQATRSEDDVPAGVDRVHDVSGGWGAFSAGKSDKRSDLPTTYQALLGLESAARCGVEVPPTVWLAALELLVGWQAPAGPPTVLRMNEVAGKRRFEWTEDAQARGFGWAGTMADSPSGYETVGGAIGLVACQDALQRDARFTPELRKKTREAIRDALAWVQANYDIAKNPYAGAGDSTRRLAASVAGPLYHHHWLQGLARVAIHARMRFVGAHDWYLEGVERLLKEQRKDGSWAAIWWQNCYALLFLTRASMSSIVPVVTESDPETAAGPAAAK